MPLSELQIVFSLVVVCMTFVTPLAGYFLDRFSYRKLVTAGLWMSAGSWIVAGWGLGHIAKDSILFLYLSYGVLGGLGAGIAFIGSTGLVQKCFPDRRGFATGLLMSGYALGPLLSTYSVAESVGSVGVSSTLLRFGGVFFILSLVVAAGLRSPHEINTPLGSPIVSVLAKTKGLQSREMLATPVFWLMFVMMTLIATCGMMITSNLSVIAAENGIGSEVFMFGMAALPLALIFDRVTNGFSRILFGFVSDHIGRENTLGVAFTLEAIFVYVWVFNLHNPTLFVLLSGLVFLAWGEIFSVFPALCTDTFGEKNASINFGFLYTSVGVGSIIGGPVAAYFREHLGSWTPVFYGVAALDLLTAMLAVFVLKKMRLKMKARQNGEGVDVSNTSELTAATAEPG